MGKKAGAKAKASGSRPASGKAGPPTGALDLLDLHPKPQHRYRACCCIFLCTNKCLHICIYIYVHIDVHIHVYTHILSDVI